MYDREVLNENVPGALLVLVILSNFLTKYETLTPREREVIIDCLSIINKPILFISQPIASKENPKMND